MNESEHKVCFYKHNGDANIVESGCNPSHAWIPQMNMHYCPFCGGHLKILRIATSQEMPAPPQTA